MDRSLKVYPTGHQMTKLVALLRPRLCRLPRSLHLPCPWPYQIQRLPRLHHRCRRQFGQHRQSPRLHTSHQPCALLTRGGLTMLWLVESSPRFTTRGMRAGQTHMAFRATCSKVLLTAWKQRRLSLTTIASVRNVRSPLLATHQFVVFQSRERHSRPMTLMSARLKLNG